MKIGADQKGKVIALAVLVAVAAAVALYQFGFSGSTEGPGGAEAPAKSAVADLQTNLDPTLHLDRLERLRSIEYKGLGRDLFHFGAAPPPPAAIAKNGPGGRGATGPATPAGPVTPPPPPPPPPIPLKFFGYATSAGVPEKIFLQMGDDSYVVEEGQIVEHRYLIEKIGKLSVRVKDLQTQEEQELPLQQG